MMATGGWAVDLIVHLSTNTTGYDFARIVLAGGTVAFGEFNFIGGGTNALSWYPVDTDDALIAPAFPAPPVGGTLTGNDGKWHHVRLTAAQDGGNVALQLYIDGELVDTGALIGHTLGAVATINTPSLAGGTDPASSPAESASIGQIVVWDTATPALSAAAAHAATVGHRQ
jgi:hypothetical protein